MQAAVLIYNDRIATYRRMLQLDETLDAEPTERDVSKMAELRIRNLQAFAELQSYNDKGVFLYKHPLIQKAEEYVRLTTLLTNNPEEFLLEHRRVLDNISRYERYLRRKDRKTKRASDRDLLNKHRNREAVFKLILETKK